MIEKENEYRAALYCRLSSDDAYLGESGSIQTQRTLLTQYCKENNIPVYDVYVDDGFSGTNFERPDFKRMLIDLENHKANLVIVKDLSRFGREYAQMGIIDLGILTPFPIPPAILLPKFCIIASSSALPSSVL